MGEAGHGVNGRKFAKLMFDRPLRQALFTSTMKRLLSLLMCYVFLQAETFALRGGPGGNRTISGGYAGVMTQTGGGSDVGLLLLNASGQGASTGQVAIFSQSSSTATTTPGFPGPIRPSSGGGSYYYLGTLTGLTDPTSGQFTGVFSAIAQGLASNTTVLATTSRTIAGTMKLKTVTARTGSIQRISGTAVTQTAISGGGGNNGVGSFANYDVSGWQVSTSTVANGFSTIDSSTGSSTSTGP